MSTHKTAWTAACLALILAVPPASAAPQSAAPAPSTAGYVGNQACAGCHTSIYRTYMRTAMARASGPALDGLVPVDFVHRPSGVRYRIYAQDNRAWLSFQRLGDPSLDGKSELLYYIGSGRRGRTYLFALDGFFFESPVNWYGDARIWDMTPGYGQAREAPLNLPALTSCLHCHVSGMQAPLPGTENRYPSPPFAYAGVICERCHGPGAAHLQGGAIINPAKLSPARRDDICMQCHEEGKVAVERRGRHIYQFRPGDNLSDYIRYYVLEDARGLSATSEFEAFSQSVCKKKSGDAMSCTRCHDPHDSPAADQRVSYYRGKCLACHGAAFGARHYPDQPYCITCHMPRTPSTDIAHTQVTDHRILRRPDGASPSLQDLRGTPAPPRLLPFPRSLDAEKDIRDTAIAWESLAATGMQAAEPEAQRQLNQAIKQSPDDPAVLAALAFLEQRQGARDRARQLYDRALALDPNDINANVNLGVLEARAGDLRKAVVLWQRAFSHSPARSDVGLALARAFCQAGQLDDARSYTRRVLEFNPDLGNAKKLLRNLDATPPRCEP